MLTIYGVYRSRALRNIWLCEEMGIPFRHVPVIQANRLPNPAAPDAPLHTRAPDFLRINPNGHIPTMDDDGLVLHESLAINLYLARKHGGPLAPKDLAEDARMTDWTLWAATEVEPLAYQVLANRVMRAPAERDAAAADGAVAALRTPFAVLEATLAESGFVVGGRFTVADINVVEVIRYTMAAPELFQTAPRVKAWLEACHARPAWKTVWAARDAEPA